MSAERAEIVERASHRAGKRISFISSTSEAAKPMTSTSEAAKPMTAGQ